MKILTIGILLTLATLGRAELVENGDFSNELKSWNLQLHRGYASVPSVRVDNDVFEADELREVNGHYFHLGQAVDIKKGKRYKLSFEAKGEGGGSYRVLIGEPGKKIHFGTKKTQPASDWEPFSFEFEGAFDTDSSWYKDWRRATRKSELAKGRTVNKDLNEIERVPRDDPPSRTRLLVLMGDLAGSFAIRNVSVVEVP